MLATYLAGSDAKVAHGLLVSTTLSVTHVAIAVVIASFSLPLVSIALGSVGRAPLLEDVSRGLLGLIGLWMIWRALSHDQQREGEAVGLMAGLIPRPLTLFVTTFAISKGSAGGGSSLCRHDDGRRGAYAVHSSRSIDPVPRAAGASVREPAAPVRCHFPQRRRYRFRPCWCRGVANFVDLRQFGVGQRSCFITLSSCRFIKILANGPFS
ncbi:hypothetical protein [Mesorhizobium sp.]|uniref:hypothetical protein n=1 Tax=Mesorhizobium sp. TaxID=1871066 RepID=UPI0011F988E9|nr:hypothetical protein [Mesorhizobium sp.]TJV13398.1 MAG: hypothetical protein E5Y07_31960 [Mesorhizobium sp.]